MPLPEFDSKPEPLDLEPVDLNLDEIPTVEVAVLSRRGFGFWKAALWCVYFLVATQILPALLLIAGLTIGKMFNGGGFLQSLLEVASDPQLTRDLLFVGPIAGILFSLYYLTRILGRGWKAKLALRTPPLVHVVLVCILVLPLLICNFALQTAFEQMFGHFHLPGSEALERLGREAATWPWWIPVLALSLGPAISEELWCRGFLGCNLVGRYGLVPGIAATSLFFGLIHLIPLQVIFASLMGVVLHLTYVASRSLFVPMLLHFLHNALGLLAESESLPISVGKSLGVSFEHQPWLMLVASAFLMAAIGWAFFQSRVRVLMPHGREAPPSLYPHVQLPLPTSSNHLYSGSMTPGALATLALASAVFAAAWVGI